MKLFERLLHLHQNPAKIAAYFAEYMRHDPEADRGRILIEFAAILRARAAFCADLEAIESDLIDRRSPWEDFDEGDAESYRAEISAWHANYQKEGADEALRIRSRVRLLDTLFHKICRALDAEGLTLTGGQISAIKRSGVPDILVNDLDAMKSELRPSLPDAERLDEDRAKCLYNGLISQGLISGSYAAFYYHLGQDPMRRAQPPKEGLRWAGNIAEFAYFARCFASHTQSEVKGSPLIREKALCHAFGISDRRRANSVRPYLGSRHEPKTKSKIDTVFATAFAALVSW